MFYSQRSCRFGRWRFSANGASMATNRILGKRLTLQLRRGLLVLAAGVIACTAVVGLRSSEQPAGATSLAKLASWGDDRFGQVTNMPSGSDFTQVSAGGYHSVALKTDGSIASWGNDGYSEVTDTPSGTDFTQVSAGYFHSVALKADGSVVSWGDDTYGEVTNTPTGTDFTQVSAGGSHSVALRADGSLVSWGDDPNGEVTYTPAGSDFTQVSAGWNHSVALKSDGSLVAWGEDYFFWGVVSNTPAGTGFTQVSAGGNYSMALRADGTLASWGANVGGVLTSMPAGNGFTQVSAGYDHSVALRSDGTLVEWGSSEYGTVTNAPSGNAFIAVSAGFYHSAALQGLTPAVVVRIGDVSVNEGSGPSGTTVSLLYGTDAPVSEPLCLWYTTENDGATGADKFTAFDGTQDYLKLGVVKPKFSLLGASKTAGKISTKVNYDAVVESDEQFMVIITKVTARVQGKCVSSSQADPRFRVERGNGFVTILDDDTSLPLL